MSNETKVLMPGATIGILGAGQLGKMMAQSAQKMGYKVATYDPNPDACAFAVSNWHICSSFDDWESLETFAGKVDVLTYEFENINGPLLNKLEDVAYLPQGTDLLLNSQHRYREKTWLRSIGVPTVNTSLVHSMDDLNEAIDRLDYPCVLKTTRFGYDGKGQVFLHGPADVEANREEIEKMVQDECVLEDFCPFIYEASEIVCRDTSGHVDFFPISQNTHIHGILAGGLAPARTDQGVEEKIHRYSETIAREGHLVGVCGVEFFVMADGEVLANEIAPRPHNSGHYTIEGCNVSQYDQHVLAICGRPIIPIKNFTPTLMVNILGQHIPHLEKAMKQFPDAVFHLYDKGEARTQRKMGHFTIMDDSIDHLYDLWDNDLLLQKWRDLF